MKFDFFTHQRIQNLDALRFMAFLAVFMEHTGLHVPEALRHEEFNSVLNGIFIRGYLGVNFFFVLSGFLISGRLMAEYHESGRINIKAYLRRRALKILPMFLVALGLAYLLSPYFFDKTETAPLSPFLLIHANMWMMKAGLPSNSLLSHLWSLSVEEQFYLLAPVLVVISLVTGLGKKLIGFLLLASVIFRASHYPYYGYIFFHSFTLFADFFCGVYLAMMVREKHWIIKKIADMKALEAAFIYLIGILLIFSQQFDFFPPYAYLSRFIYALFFAFVLAHQSLSQHERWHLSRLPLAERAGLISYGLYIFHPLGILLAAKVWSISGISLNNPYQHYILHFMLGLPLTFLLAYGGEKGSDAIKSLLSRRKT